MIVIKRLEMMRTKAQMLSYIINYTLDKTISIIIIHKLGRSGERRDHMYHMYVVTVNIIRIIMYVVTVHITNVAITAFLKLTKNVFNRQDIFIDHPDRFRKRQHAQLTEPFRLTNPYGHTDAF